MFGSGNRRIIIDMRYTKKIEEDVVRRLADCYHAIKKQKFGCTFRNIPHDVKKFLEELEKPVHEIQVSDEPERALYTRKEMLGYLSANKESKEEKSSLSEKSA